MNTNTTKPQTLGEAIALLDVASFEQQIRSAGRQGATAKALADWAERALLSVGFGGGHIAQKVTVAKMRKALGDKLISWEVAGRSGREARWGIREDAE